MARPRPHAPPPRAGRSVVLMFAGAVLGIGLVMILAYHFLLASHGGTGETTKISEPSGAVHAANGPSSDLAAAQADLLKPAPETASGPQPEPAK